MKVRCIAVLLLLGSLWTAGPARGAAGAAATPAIWINVPFVAQTKDGCGSATMAMVMHYWDRKQGLPVTANQDAAKIQSALFSRAAGGIYASRMRQYFRQSGYEAFAFHGEWNDLEHHLALGRPLIAAIQASGAHGPLHYVVVVGIDSKRGYVFLNDPAQQKMLRISREGFESEWHATHNWTLLAVPKSAH